MKTHLTETHDCSERIYKARGLDYPCSRKGTVERDDKWWCRQHDPVEVKRRRAASSAISQQQYEDRMTAYHREAVVIAACKDFETDWLEAGGLQRQQVAITSLLSTLRRHEAGDEGDDYLYSIADDLRKALP